MAEVSRRLGAGLQKLSSLSSPHVLSATNRPPAASAGPCCSGGAALESRGERGERGSEDWRAGRVKLEDLPGTNSAGSGLQYEPLRLIPQPSLTPDLVLLDSELTFIVGVIGQLPPVGSSSRSSSSYRMACWVNRSSVLLTTGSSRMQNAEHFHRAYCTLLLLTHRQPKRLPGVTITQACSWSSNQSSDEDLHRSRTAYYEILQVPPNATQAQIKTAYYKQSFLYHPDKNPGREEATYRFAQISEAYSILGSVGLRKKYDRGILSSADVQGAGRPSGKDTSASSRSSGPQQQGQRRSQKTSTMTVGGKPVFNFDAFFQAHYGEQLQREQAMRQWRQQSEQRRKEELANRKLGRFTEMAVGMLLAMGVFVMFSLRS